MRESEFRRKYGLIAAGSLSRTIIGRIRDKAREIGSVAAVSYRVASRIANSLRAGHPVRDIQDIEPQANLLFHAPDDQMDSLVELSLSSGLNWKERRLIFCDCEPSRAAICRFMAAGVSVAVVRIFAIPGFAVVQGCPPAVSIARRIARNAELKPLEIKPECSALFEAAVTLGTAALTPLIDRVALLFRSAGLRDAESVRLAQLIFRHTVGGYAHSGRQSWAWHMGEPRVENLRAEIAALDPDLAALFGRLVLLGFDVFDKHRDIASWLRPQILP